MRIPLVENPVNPRRRRRRGTADVTIGQRRYLAVPLRKQRTRRNPDLMTLGGINPRRRHRRNELEFLANRRRHRYGRRRHNPAMLGGLTKRFDTQAILGSGLGILVARNGVNFVKNKVWASMPSTGVVGAVARIAVGFGFSELLRMLKQPRLAQYALTGSTAAVLADLAATGAGAIGLGGLSEDDVTADELLQAIEGDMSGYVFESEPVMSLPTGAMGGYVTAEEGLTANAASEFPMY